MGNPVFALPTLKAIIQSDHELIAAVSNPPKKMGRGKLLSHTPVGNFSKDHGIPLIAQKDLQSINFKNKLENLKPDIFVVVAFKILPKVIINIPSFGSLNLHASLLPRYRGAGPIQWALMNGEKTTGVTIFQIEPKVDTGDILMQKRVDIKEEDNMFTLGMRLCKNGANMMIETLNNIEKGNQIKRLRQNTLLATPAPKIQKEMTIINWGWEAKKIHNWVRGLTPYPGMSTNYNGKRLRIFKTSVITGTNINPGKIVEAKDDRLIVATGKDLIRIYEMQTDGKRRMHVSDFLRGNKMKVGETLSI